MSTTITPSSPGPSAGSVASHSANGIRAPQMCFRSTPQRGAAGYPFCAAVISTGRLAPFHFLSFGQHRRWPENPTRLPEVKAGNTLGVWTSCVNDSIQKHEFMLCYKMACLIPFLTVWTAVQTMAEDSVNLFILSGQSNMVRLQPQESFTPMVEGAFGKENVIVVKDAEGAQPIRRWYKKWKSTEGATSDTTGDLYDRLMAKVTDATRERKIGTVTFVWMQGERDAKKKHGTVYEASLKGLVDQLSTDLKRTDVNFVIGRLSDFDLKNEKYPHWTMIRKVQVKVGTERPHSAWVDTDDLNDGKNRKGKSIGNDLHYSADGYRQFGSRLAEAAIKLVKAAKR